MASVEYRGSHYNNSYGYVWHDKNSGERGVVMSGGGTLTATRNGSTISGSVSGAWTQLKNSGAYYGYPITIRVLANGSVVASKVTSVSISRSGNQEILRWISF